MERVRPLDELTPADLWREVPESEDEFWRDTREKQVRLLKALLEGTQEEEVTVLLGVCRFRRVEGRRGYRNGFYERDLATQAGVVTAIRVPRARGSAVERSVFSRYQRRQAQVNQVIRDVFLAGVSLNTAGWRQPGGACGGGGKRPDGLPARRPSSGHTPAGAHIIAYRASNVGHSG